MKRDDILSMLADIISRIIHDYNNVIGAVEGYATLLSAEVKDSGAIEDLNEILNVVSKASKIRNKLALFYRKNVSGKEYIDINDIIAQKSSHYENKSNIKVNLELSKNIPSLYAKNDEIDLMITEFFENAIYHSKKENLEISVKTYSIENDLILEFSDNGAGIKEENYFTALNAANYTDALCISVKGENQPIHIFHLITKAEFVFPRILLSAKRSSSVVVNEFYTTASTANVSAVIEVFLEENANVNWLFNGAIDLDNLGKTVIEFEYLGMECKCEIDDLSIDHLNKKIIITEIKTSYDIMNAFEYTYLKRRYDLAAAFYYIAVNQKFKNDENLDGYDIEFQFLAVDTSKERLRPLIYKLSGNDILNAVNGFRLKTGSYYKGLVELIQEIKWSSETQNWNISEKAFENNGILNLEINYE